MTRNAPALFAAVMFAATGLAGGADAAVVLNGGFTVTTTTSQIGTVPDTTGFTNLTLFSGVPQNSDLFDIFSLAPVTTQPISVSFSLSEQGAAPVSTVVSGTITGSPGAEDLGSVTFAPNLVRFASGDFMNIKLSSASFGNDFNGTVIATFTVPEPASAMLLGVGLSGVAAASIARARRTSSSAPRPQLVG